MKINVCGVLYELQSIKNAFGGLFWLQELTDTKMVYHILHHQPIPLEVSDPILFQAVPCQWHPHLGGRMYYYCSKKLSRQGQVGALQSLKG